MHKDDESGNVLSIDANPLVVVQHGNKVHAQSSGELKQNKKNRKRRKLNY